MNDTFDGIGIGIGAVIVFIIGILILSIPFAIVGVILLSVAKIFTSITITYFNCVITGLAALIISGLISRSR